MLSLCTHLAALQHPPSSRLLARPARKWLNFFSSSASPRTIREHLAYDSDYPYVKEMKRESVSMPERVGKTIREHIEAYYDYPYVKEKKQEIVTKTKEPGKGDNDERKTMDDIKFPLHHRPSERVPQLVIKNENMHHEDQARAEEAKAEAEAAYAIALMDVASV